MIFDAETSQTVTIFYSIAMIIMLSIAAPLMWRNDRDWRRHLKHKKGQSQD